MKELVKLYALMIPTFKQLWFLVTIEGEILSYAQTTESWIFNDLIFTRSEILEKLADRYGAKGYDYFTAVKVLSPDEYSKLIEKTIESVKALKLESDDQIIGKAKTSFLGMAVINNRVDNIKRYRDGIEPNNKFWQGAIAGITYTLGAMEGADPNVFNVPTFPPVPPSLADRDINEKFIVCKPQLLGAIASNMIQQNQNCSASIGIISTVITKLDAELQLSFSHSDNHFIYIKQDEAASQIEGYLESALISSGINNKLADFSIRAVVRQALNDCWREHLITQNVGKKSDPQPEYMKGRDTVIHHLDTPPGILPAFPNDGMGE